MTMTTMTTMIAKGTYTIKLTPSPKFLGFTLLQAYRKVHDHNSDMLAGFVYLAKQKLPPWAILAYEAMLQNNDWEESSDHTCYHKLLDEESLRANTTTGMEMARF